MYKCKYCNKEFNVLQALMGHVSRCKDNPKYLIACQLRRKNRNVLKFICPKCNIEFTQIVKENSKQRIKKFCSRKCANARCHAIETRIKIGNSKRQFPTEYKLICKNCNREFIVAHKYRNKKTCSNICRLAVTVPILKNAAKTICKTNEFRTKVATGSVLSYKNGRHISGGNTKWIELITTNGKIKVQGSYEVRMVKILESWKENKKILNWEYTSDRFEYVDTNNAMHTYLMDFKVINIDNTFYYIETKGRIRENDVYKWNAVRTAGYKLEVIFKKDLEKLEQAI